MFNARNVLLTLLYDLRLKASVTILRDFYLGFTKISTYFLGFLSVAVVGVVGAFI